MNRLLPNARLVGFQRLMDVHKDRIRGLALGNHGDVGDLSDCFKIYFDPSPDFQDSPRFRLVYQHTEAGVAGISVQTVGVSAGRRSGLDAYHRAAANLGRTPSP